MHSIWPAMYSMKEGVHDEVTLCLQQLDLRLELRRWLMSLNTELGDRARWICSCMLSYIMAFMQHQLWHLMSRESPTLEQLVVTEAGLPCRVFSVEIDQSSIYPQTDNVLVPWIDVSQSGFGFTTIKNSVSCTQLLGTHACLSVR